MLEEKRKVSKAMADNLGMLRKKIKITQEELAEKIGISRHTVIAIESGKTEMNWSVCLALILLFSENSETKKLLDVLEITGDDFTTVIDTESVNGTRK